VSETDFNYSSFQDINMPNKANLNALQKFLIWSAGANHEILAQEICLTERYKYESIGTTVVLTSIMAFFSGGYALFTVFSSVPVSIALGTVWGFTIFNLDRFFILTANQGKSDSRWQFLMASILRLSIAVLLSLVVAKPLELRLFEREINQEINQGKIDGQRQERKKQQEELENTPESKRINEINVEIRSLGEERKNRNDDLQKARTDVIKEWQGITGKPGKGDLYNAKKEVEEKLEQEVNKLDNRLRNLDDEKKNLTEEQRLKFGKFIPDPDVSQQTKRKEQSSSLLERLSALERLSKRDPTVAATNLLTTILFIIIEISPILVKILSKQGLYEELIEKENKYKTSQEKLHELKEKEILKLEELKDLELKIEVMMIEYLRLKERNKEKLENMTIDDIKIVIKQQYQENNKFIQICIEQLENYKYIADKVLDSDID
jgi:hypothetical protein